MSDAFILYFSLAQGPTVMGMSSRWLRQEIRRGLPHLKTEGKILLDPIRVREYMESHYTPKPVDLAAAYRQAEELTSGRRRERKAAR